MDFKTKPIRKNSPPPKNIQPQEEPKEKPPEKIFKKEKFPSQLLLTLGATLAILFLIGFAVFQVVKSLDLSSIIFSFSEPLQKDTQGKTNVLLIGIGGEGHDGPNLTDTLMLTSIDYENKAVSMLSIPRDLWVKNKEIDGSKINSVYAISRKKGSHQALQILENTLTEISDLPLQYYIKIDFKGFEKIIDSLGGVDVIVEKDLYDNEYPIGETGRNEVFSLKAGPQHLDGATALKFARSRHGTSGGDTGRAQRQQQLISAVKEKALSLNILTNPTTLRSLYNSVNESIETNLTIGEMIEMAKTIKSFDTNTITPIVLNDDPTACGGFLYVPDRKYFGEASVFLPAGNNYDFLHLFVDTVFKNNQLLKNKEEIQVLNGTKVPGLAYEGMAHLSRFCLNVVYYTNAENRNLETTTIYYKPGSNGEEPAILPLIKTLIPQVQTVAGIPPSYLEGEKRQNSVIVIELGKDYLSKRLKNPFDTLKYLSTPTSQQEAVTSSTQETSEKATQSTQ